MNHSKQITCTLFFIFVLAFFNVRSQDARKVFAESLKAAKDDTSRCAALITFGEAVYLEEPDTAVKYWSIAKGLSLKSSQNETRQKVKDRLLFFYSTALNDIGSIYIDQGEVKLAIQYTEEALSVSEKTNDVNGVASAYSNLGYIYSQQGEVNRAIKCFKNALEWQKKINDQHGIATVLNNIGLIYSDKGEIPQALDQFHQSLRIREKINDKQGIAATLNNIAGVFMKQNDMQHTFEYLDKILKLYEEVKDKQGQAETLNNYGYVYDQMGNTDKALEYHFRSLKLRQEINDLRGVAVSYHNLAYVYENRGEIDKALKYNKDCIAIREKMNDQYGLSHTLNNTARLLFEQNRTADAMIYAQKGLEVSKLLGYPADIRNASWMMKRIYEKQGKYKNALEMYKLSRQMGDSVSNEKNQKASIKKQFEMDYEIRAAKDSIANAAKINEERLRHEQAIAKQRTYTYGGAAGLCLMLIVAGISFTAYRNKQRSNITISAQKKEVEEQKELIEEKQKEIMDSINYARRIQLAHLPTEKYILKKFEELKSKM